MYDFWKRSDWPYSTLQMYGFLNNGFVMKGPDKQGYDCDISCVLFHIFFSVHGLTLIPLQSAYVQINGIPLLFLCTYNLVTALLQNHKMSLVFKEYLLF